MSTKIYDAYKFNKKYSLDELFNIIDTWRKDITNIAEINFAKLCFEYFTNYYDLTTIKGPDFILCKKYNDDSIQEKRLYNYMYDTFSKLNTDEFSVNNCMIAITEILRFEINRTDDPFNYMQRMFSSKIYLYNVANKIIFLYFGDNEYCNYIENQDIIQDYHYQDQTDRPSNISSNAWKTRRKNWDIAIGSDYIPSNHGISANFININGHEFSIFNKYLKTNNITEDLFPSIEQRAKFVIKFFNDYPNPPKNGSYSEVLDYLESEEYLNWYNNKTQEIISKLNTNIIDVIKHKGENIYETI